MLNIRFLYRLAETNYLFVCNKICVCNSIKCFSGAFWVNFFLMSVSSRYDVPNLNRYRSLTSINKNNNTTSTSLSYSHKPVKWSTITIDNSNCFSSKHSTMASRVFPCWIDKGYWHGRKRACQLIRGPYWCCYDSATKLSLRLLWRWNMSLAPKHDLYENGYCR